MLSGPEDDDSRVGADDDDEANDVVKDGRSCAKEAVDGRGLEAAAAAAPDALPKRDPERVASVRVRGWGMPRVSDRKIFLRSGCFRATKPDSSVVYHAVGTPSW
jgi:hypothetical protein